MTEDGLGIYDLYEMTICDCVDEYLSGFLVQYLDEEGLTPEYLIENPKHCNSIDESFISLGDEARDHSLTIHGFSLL